MVPDHILDTKKNPEFLDMPLVKVCTQRVLCSYYNVFGFNAIVKHYIGGREKAQTITRFFILVNQ